MLTLVEYIEQSSEVCEKELKNVKTYLEISLQRMGINCDFVEQVVDFDKLMTRKDLIDSFNEQFKENVKGMSELNFVQRIMLEELSEDIHSPLVLKWNDNKKILEMEMKSSRR